MMLYINPRRQSFEKGTMIPLDHRGSFSVNPCLIFMYTGSYRLRCDTIPEHARAVVALSIFILFIPVLASNPPWVQNKRTRRGGTVNCLALSICKPFAGTEGGDVYLSTNEGMTWRVARTELTLTDMIATRAREGYVRETTKFASPEHGRSFDISAGNEYIGVRAACDPSRHWGEGAYCRASQAE